MTPVVLFIRDLFERALKTAAQVALLEFGRETASAGAVSIFVVNWWTILGLSAGGFILSTLTSIGSASFGNQNSASLVKGLPVTTLPTVAGIEPADDAVAAAQAIYQMPSN